MEKNLLTSKLLGGIGATLCVLSIIPHLGTIAGIAGIITVLISLNMFSKIFNDPQIFKNALISVIISIIAAILIFFTIGLGFFSMIIKSGSYPYTINYLNIGKKLLFFLILTYILFVISGYYIKNAFYLLAYYTKISLFKTAGLLYFISSFLLILVIGGVGIIIAWILIAVAFFTMPSEIKNSI